MVHQIGIRVSCQDSSSTGTDAFITSSFSTTSGTTSSSNSSQLLTPSTTSTTCGTDKTSFTMGILNIATPPSILTRHFPPASGNIPEGSLRCELFSPPCLSILRQTPRMAFLLQHHHTVHTMLFIMRIHIPSWCTPPPPTPRPLLSDSDTPSRAQPHQSFHPPCSSSDP